MWQVLSRIKESAKENKAVIVAVLSVLISISSRVVRMIILYRSRKGERAAGAGRAGARDSAGPLKCVFLIRKDLNMSPGKSLVQVSHATSSLVQHFLKKSPGVFRAWSRQGQPKIGLKVESQEEMEALVGRFRAEGVDVFEVRDAGRTQVKAGSWTVSAAGPAESSVIDKVSGHLKLY